MIRPTQTTARLLLVALLALPVQALSHWQLNNDLSQLSFVSIKAGNVAEVHKFTGLSGGIDADGGAEISIDLTSVDTLIEIRNERMLKLLFETDRFPIATITAQLDPAQMSAVAVGASVTMDVDATLSLKQQSLAVSSTLQVTRVSSRRVLVNTIAPIVINADALQLQQGVEALREIAGLPSISLAVPVTFQLTFDG